MSIRVMSLVFYANLTHSPKTKTRKAVSRSAKKAVLLAIADNTNDEGESAYPSLRTLEVKTGLTRPTILLVIEVLNETGFLKVGEVSKLQSNTYEINVEKLEEIQNDRSPDVRKAKKLAASGKPSLPPGGKPSLPPEDLSGKPSLPNPSLINVINTSEGESNNQDKKEPEEPEPKNSTWGIFGEVKEGREELAAILEKAQGTVHLNLESWMSPDLADLARVFCGISEIDPPEDKTGRSRWLKTLREWTKNKYTPKQVQNVCDYMKERNLTISGPWSISGMLSNKIVRDRKTVAPRPERTHSAPIVQKFVPGVTDL